MEIGEILVPLLKFELILLAFAQLDPALRRSKRYTVSYSKTCAMGMGWARTCVSIVSLVCFRVSFVASISMSSTRYRSSE